MYNENDLYEFLENSETKKTILQLEFSEFIEGLENIFDELLIKNNLYKLFLIYKNSYLIHNYSLYLSDNFDARNYFTSDFSYEYFFDLLSKKGLF